jgi:hypothetical protein
MGPTDQEAELLTTWSRRSVVGPERKPERRNWFMGLINDAHGDNRANIFRLPNSFISDFRMFSV